MQRIKNRIDDKTFIKMCKESESMAQACAKLGLHFNSFKKRALELECYVTNQAGIGVKKIMPLIPIEEIIFQNKHPQYQTFKLKKRLINNGFIKKECNECGLGDSWNGKNIEHELDHIDGDSKNHHITNLRLLCPNCHSQTDTFRAKNR
jgi:hypothetical protein